MVKDNHILVLIFCPQPNYQAVFGYIFKTYTGYVQAVFVDGEPHKSAVLVQTLQQQFENGRCKVVLFLFINVTDNGWMFVDEQKARLGIASSQPEYSEKWFHGPSPYNDSGSGMYDVMSFFLSKKMTKDILLTMLYML